MPVFQLTNELVFPNPLLSEDGLLAIGGDLSTERLLLAYKKGIFPWYNEGDPILWHAPNPRCVLFPEKFICSKSLQRLINQKTYSCTTDKNFKFVIGHCKTTKRKNQDGTWITNEMERAYIELHKLGFAHSIEVWNSKNEIIGGLYGILLGKTFFGESMFSLESNSSKIAFHFLVNNFDVELIDCQVYTEHLESLGAEEIDLECFLELIK